MANPEKRKDMIKLNTKYKKEDPAINIGMYFKPSLMVPFSIIEIIIDENPAIIAKAIKEKFLKFPIEMPEDPKLKGKFAFCKVPDKLSVKLDITKSN